MARKKSRKGADPVTVDLDVADAILNRCQALARALNREIEVQTSVEAFAGLLQEQLGRLQECLYGDLEEGA